ncbi:MAG TPA: DUF503 domain-containing protein [Anaerolineales bacterium]
MIGTLTIHLHLPSCGSLKEKRGRIKPLMSRMQREFNVSVAEMDRQDQWQEAVIACAVIGTGRGHLEATLQAVVKWIEANWPDGMVVDERIELIP